MASSPNSVTMDPVLDRLAQILEICQVFQRVVPDSFPLTNDELTLFFAALSRVLALPRLVLPKTERLHSCLPTCKKQFAH